MAPAERADVARYGQPVTVELTTLDAARAAAERIRSYVQHPLMVPAPRLSDRLQADVWLKPELDQPTGSFKVRGVFNAALSMSDEARRRGLAAFSAGNHAAAVAHVGRMLGVPVTVCMPAHAVPRKIEATRALGADVMLVEHDLVGTAQRLVAERGLTLVHPFDDPAIVAGHASLGLELVEQRPDVDLVVVPVGGGGLISGVAAAVKQLAPTARVVGVEPETSDVVSRSLAAGEPIVVAAPRSIADGLTAPITGEVPFAHIKSFVDSVVRVPDEAIEEALGIIVREEGIIAEPAAAAGLAGVLTGAVPVPAGAQVVFVISGANIAPELLERVRAEA
jgi:threonine dehydratase